MESNSETLCVTIPPGKTLRVRDARGLMVQVVEGIAWITEAGDLDDYALEDGDKRSISGNGLMLVHAFEETWLRIAAPLGVGRATVEMGAGYNEFAAAVWKRSTVHMARRVLVSLRRWIVQNRTHEAGNPVLQERGRHGACLRVVGPGPTTRTCAAMGHAP